VTVLKGPNAAALYGSRASNGAIVIVTKNGRGGPSDAFGVTATFGTTLETPLRLPDYQNQYGQGFYGEVDFVDGDFDVQNGRAEWTRATRTAARTWRSPVGRRSPTAGARRRRSTTSTTASRTSRRRPTKRSTRCRASSGSAGRWIRGC